MPRNLVVLGSTGSIGRQTLDIASQFPEDVRIYGLATRRNAALLAEQSRIHRPAAVALLENSTAGFDFGGAELHSGSDAVQGLCEDPVVDLVIVAFAGAGGLMPTLAALRAGKLVALANKETLVMAGPIIQAVLRSSPGRLVPIDSEHSALWQCLQGEDSAAIERLVLTASGGALRDLTDAELAAVTPEQALRHPTWSMGRKITVDSANLMNKGLEVLEATSLFHLTIDQVDVLMHPQSIVHSLVEFRDSSVKAQLGLPDMRVPIQYALSHPHRWPNTLPRLRLDEIGALNFGPVDYDRYPALRLAVEAGRAGGVAPAVLSAADEEAVEAFLARRIGFQQIPVVVEETLAAHAHCGSPTVDDILDADAWARRFARRLMW